MVQVTWMRLLTHVVLNYTVNGVICSGYLSNEDNACIAPVVTPSWVKCSTGYTYDPATEHARR